MYPDSNNSSITEQKFMEIEHPSPGCGVYNLSITRVLLEALDIGVPSLFHA